MGPAAAGRPLEAWPRCARRGRASPARTKASPPVHVFSHRAAPPRQAADSHSTHRLSAMVAGAAA